MTEELRKRVHDLDATLRVGKGGIESVVGELERQLEDADLVKVKFLRASRGGADVEELAADLGERAGAELFETRGNTAVYH
jgi:RNA-binding protein